MALKPSDLILKMFAYGERLLTELLSFCSSLFTQTLGQYAEALLGDLPSGVADWFVFKINMFELFLFSIPILVSVTMVKWIIGIIT